MVVVVTKREAILLVSTNLILPPTAIIELCAASFPMEISLRDVRQYWGLGDFQCQGLLAISR